MKLSQQPTSPQSLCYTSTWKCWVKGCRISLSSESHTSSNPHHQVLSVGSSCKDTGEKICLKKQLFFCLFSLSVLKNLLFLEICASLKCENCSYRWLSSHITSFPASERCDPIILHTSSYGGVSLPWQKQGEREIFSSALTTSKWPDVSNAHREEVRRQVEGRSTCPVCHIKLVK